MGPFTAWQATRILLLIALSLQAQQSSAQPGILPPMPPLGFFGGLLDGLGLGPSSPPATSSTPVVSPTYRTPQSSPSIQPQDGSSASTGTIVPVVSSSPASLAPPTAAGAAAAASAVPTATVTPSIPAAVRSPPATAASAVAASAVPVATMAPTNPAAPVTPVTAPRAATAVATPAAVRSVTTAPAAPVATPAPPVSSAPTPVPTPGAAVVITPAGVVVQTPVPSTTPAAAKPAATPAATAAPAVPTVTPAAVTAAPAVPTPTPTIAAAVPAATVAPRMELPPLPRPMQVPLRTPSPTPTPTPTTTPTPTPSPDPVDMVPLPAALAPLLASAPKTAPAPVAPAISSPPPPPFVVQDPTQTALSAAFLVQGPNVWPFDSGKQAAFVSALQSTLPGIKPGGITVTSTGAPFRRRVLLQMLSSALVATQVDAGSAAQVPAVLAQLRNATDQGQLQGAMQTQGLQVSSLQLQAATAVVPTNAGSGSAPLSVPFIVGIIVVGVVVLLCIFGAAYFGLFRCCMPNHAHRQAAEEQKAAPAKGSAQNDVAPFFEVPKFQQTYPRAPSLVSQSNPVFDHGRPPRIPSRQSNGRETSHSQVNLWQADAKTAHAKTAHADCAQFVL